MNWPFEDPALRARTRFSILEQICHVVLLLSSVEQEGQQFEGSVTPDIIRLSIGMDAGLGLDAAS